LSIFENIDNKRLRRLKWVISFIHQSQLRLIRTYHAIPMPRLCRSPAMPCQKGFRMCLAHLIYSAAVVDLHMPSHASAMPRPCRSESDFSSSRHSAAWAWHGMCELASAVQRQHVDDLSAFGFFRLRSGVPRRLLPEAYQPVKL
jgi:hypothetical protein